MNAEKIKELFNMKEALSQELVNYIIIYLRKSRKDNDFNKEESLEKTLQRHETMLQEYAENIFGCKIPEKNIFREIVSGDTIADRPEMQKVLELIENDNIKGVLCVEIERLARGNSIDQGIIAQKFQFTNTKILTLQKIFDLDDEYDMSFFEEGLYQSRRFLQYTKKILKRGREQAVKEGKNPGHTTYGLDNIKIIGEKGYTRKQNNDAKIVRKIYESYLYEDIKPPTIANNLNDLGIPSPGGLLWTAQAVMTILKRYEKYAGFETWNERQTVLKYVNGEVKKTKPLNSNYIKVKGRFEGIINEKEANLVKQKLAKNSLKIKKEFHLQNPLAGLIKCKKCNHNLVRHKSHKSNHEATLICTTPGCKMPSSYLDIIEDHVIKELKNILINYEKHLKDFNTVDFNKIKKLELEKKSFKNRLETIKSQKIKCCEYLETNIYDEDMFKSRINALNEQIDKTNEHLHAIDRNIAEIKKEDINSVIPNIKNCLRLYDNATVEEKNELLSQIIDVVYYSKEKAGRWENTTDKFNLEIKLKI